MKKITSFIVNAILFLQTLSAPISSMSNNPVYPIYESKEYNMIESKSQILATIENIVKNSEDKIKNAIKIVFSNSDLLFGAFSLGLNPTILNHMCEVVSSILLNYDDSVRSIINSIDFNDKDPNATTLFIFAFTKIYNILCDSNLDIK